MATKENIGERMARLEEKVDNQADQLKHIERKQDENFKSLHEKIDAALDKKADRKDVEVIQGQINRGKSLMWKAFFVIGGSIITFLVWFLQEALQHIEK